MRTTIKLRSDVGAHVLCLQTYLVRSKDFNIMLLAATSIIGSLAKSSSESQSRAVVHDKILDRIRANIYVHVIEHTTHCVCSYS